MNVCGYSFLTPEGESAIQVVHCHGAGWSAHWETSFDDPKQSLGEPGRLTYGTLRPDDEAIDEVLIACVDRENWELNLHGGSGVRNALRRWFESIGAREIAEIEEDDRFAMVGRARTRKAAALLADWADGTFQRFIKENPTPEQRDEARGRATLGRAALGTLKVGLVGPPNAGKSTLFNRLLGEERAIVHETPGTTRDWLSGWIHIHDWPVELIDTAGLDTFENEIDETAVSHSLYIAEKSDALVFVVDPSQPIDSSWFERIPIDIVVLAQSDRTSDLDDPTSGHVPEKIPRVRCSAVASEGLETLLEELCQCLSLDSPWSPGIPVPVLPADLEHLS